MSDHNNRKSSESSFTPESAGAIDYKDLLKLCRKHWWWFVASLLLFIGIGLLQKYRTLPKALVEANVMVRPEKSSLGNIASQMDVSAFDLQSQEVDDELAIISSYSVINKVVHLMKLNNRYTVQKNILKKVPAPENSPLEIFYDSNIPDTLSYGLTFKVTVHENQLADIKVKCGKKGKIKFELEDKKLPCTIKTPFGLFAINKTRFFKAGEKLKETIQVLPYGFTTESLKDDLSIKIPSKRANLIRITCESNTPGFAVKVIDNLIKEYQAQNVDVKRASQSRTLSFVNDRLNRLAQELSVSEGDIEKFKRDNKLTDISTDIAFTMNKMGEIQSNLLSAETHLELVNMARTFLANPDNRHSLIPTMGEASQGVSLPGVHEYNQLILKRMELANNAKGENTVLRQLDERIDAMRTNVLASLERTYTNQRAVVANLREKNSESLSRISDLPTSERQYITIKRQQAIQEKIFLYLLQLREETELNIAKAEPRSDIIDQAFVYSTPLGMGMKKMLAIMIVLGLGLPFAAVFLLYKFRTKFSSKADVEKLTSIPIYGEMCTDSTGDKVVVTAEASSSTAELFRAIRTGLKYSMQGTDDKVILVTSTTSGEGKSFISVNLAYTIAFNDKKTLLLGADIRKPRLPEYLGIRPRFGLTEYLSNSELSLSQITTKAPGCQNLDVITAGPIPPNPAELLDSPKFKAMLTELRKQYDVIVIDSAPVGMVSDTFTIAPLADITLYVCRAEYTPIDDIRFACEVYDEHRLPRMGLVVNGTHISKGYGYGYGENHTHKRH
ncbi:MAG: polysaccharide biosynthesis tyrosine autokinase [Candidatus Amulumruptor caecigallinarius]|nr:polysaccharide biosynthesis tyrosine autokinase [Candidatus Amulumruptor caecigallinarius]MCM1396261.1 polysaccharide biosynthesis tyrosine autokinase [Candidatus Amulumruptor caecigallinarius]MCM1454255.1 polysaccharide biosynthesis tyrosine autokinase [bacterium]